MLYVYFSKETEETKRELITAFQVIYYPLIKKNEESLYYLLIFD